VACQVGSVSLVGSGCGHVAWFVLEELSIVVPFLRRAQDAVVFEYRAEAAAGHNPVQGGVTEQVQGARASM